MADEKNDTVPLVTGRMMSLVYEGESRTRIIDTGIQILANRNHDSKTSSRILKVMSEKRKSESYTLQNEPQMKSHSYAK